MRRVAASCALLALLTLPIAGCGAASASTSSGGPSSATTGGSSTSSRPPTPLLDTTWTVRSTSDGSKAAAVPASVHAVLRFAEDGSQVRVQSGCNSGGLDVTARTTRAPGEGSLTLRRGIFTMMACLAPKGTVERAVRAVLSGQVGYRIDRDTLTLTKGPRTLTLVPGRATG